MEETHGLSPLQVKRQSPTVAAALWNPHTGLAALTSEASTDSTSKTPASVNTHQDLNILYLQPLRNDLNTYRLTRCAILWPGCAAAACQKGEATALILEGGEF